MAAGSATTEAMGARTLDEIWAKRPPPLSPFVPPGNPSTPSSADATPPRTPIPARSPPVPAVVAGAGVMTGGTAAGRADVAATGTTGVTCDKALRRPPRGLLLAAMGAAEGAPAKMLATEPKRPPPEPAVGVGTASWVGVPTSGLMAELALPLPRTETTTERGLGRPSSWPSSSVSFRESSTLVELPISSRGSLKKGPCSACQSRLTANSTSSGEKLWPKPGKQAKASQTRRPLA